VKRNLPNHISYLVISATLSALLIDHSLYFLHFVYSFFSAGCMPIPKYLYALGLHFLLSSKETIICYIITSSAVLTVSPSCAVSEILSFIYEKEKRSHG